MLKLAVIGMTDVDSTNLEELQQLTDVVEISGQYLGVQKSADRDYDSFAEALEEADVLFINHSVEGIEEFLIKAFRMSKHVFLNGWPNLSMTAWSKIESICQEAGVVFHISNENSTRTLHQSLTGLVQEPRIIKWDQFLNVSELDSLKLGFQTKMANDLLSLTPMLNRKTKSIKANLVESKKAPLALMARFVFEDASVFDYALFSGVSGGSNVLQVHQDGQTLVSNYLENSLEITTDAPSKIFEGMEWEKDKKSGLSRSKIAFKSSEKANNVASWMNFMECIIEQKDVSDKIHDYHKVAEILYEINSQTWFQTEES